MLRVFFNEWTSVREGFVSYKENWAKLVSGFSSEDCILSENVNVGINLILGQRKFKALSVRRIIVR